MVTAARSRPQIHMEDKIVNDPELEQMLEDRQELKQAQAEYRKKDKEVKAKLASVETPCRIGRFFISKSTTPPRSVAFDTSGSVRYSIKLAGEE